MKKIKTGNVEIGTDEFNTKTAKFRMNMFVDLDVIDQIRKFAASEHMPYQTWINRKLREVVEGQSDSSTIAQEKITQLIDERIEQRVDRKVLKRVY